MATKYEFIELVTGLGNSEVYFCIPGNGANISKFWDFVGLAWVTPITADCKVFATEYNSDSTVSIYRATITLPSSGGPFLIYCYRQSTSKLQGQDVTEVTDIATVCTEARLAELDQANLPADVAAVLSAVQNVGSISLISTNLIDLIRSLTDDWIKISVYVKDLNGLPFDPADITPDGDPRLYNGVGATVSDEEGNIITGYKTEGGVALDLVTGICAHHTAQSNKPQIFQRDSAGHYFMWINRKETVLSLGRFSMEVAMFNITQASATYDADHILDTTPTSHLKQEFNVIVSDPMNVIGTGANTVTITVYENGTTTPIPSLVIAFYNSDLSTFHGNLTTNLSGQIVTNLPDGTYKLKGFKAGYSADNPTETFVVSSVLLTKTIYQTPIVIGAPGASDACRVYEYAFQPNGTTPMAALTATMRIVTLPYSKDGKVLSGDTIPGTYAPATGLVYWDIIRGSAVEVYCEALYGDSVQGFTVPETATARIATIMGT